MRRQIIGKGGGRCERFGQAIQRYKMASKYIKMFNFTTHQEIQNQAHNEISLNTNQNR